MPALEAIGNLLVKELRQTVKAGWSDGLSAHFDIELAPLNDKSARFYRYFVPLRQKLVSVLAENYRRCFKLALAHPHQIERDPHEWALFQLQPAIHAAIEWIRDWYILACDGAQPIASVEVTPGQRVSIPIPLTVPPSPTPKSWLAPAWLFGVSLAFFGIGALKTEHIPETNSDEKLSAAHTRLLLKGARRMFLWELEAAIENVKNEETAAAGFVHLPTKGTTGEKRPPNKRKGWESRVKLYDAIQKILSTSPNLEGIEFCAELDKRHAPPLFDWIKHEQWREGLTWKEAWTDRRLREKIRRVRQEAMKTR